MLNNINSKNYNIKVYDDVLPLLNRYSLYEYIKKSHFQIGWEDTGEIEYSNFKYLHSLYNNEDLLNLNFINLITNNNSELKLLFTTHTIVKCVVNLSRPMDVYFNHCHHQDKVLLYYANLRWKEEWGGETLFYDDNLRDIFYASAYTPGRIIVFDGKIPHTLRAQASIGTQFRFTFSIFLNKNNA